MTNLLIDRFKQIQETKFTNHHLKPLLKSRHQKIADASLLINRRI